MTSKQFKTSQQVPHQSAPGGAGTQQSIDESDPFGSTAARHQCQEDYYGNLTFKPDVQYQTGTPSNKVHQKRRHDKFGKKKNDETVKIYEKSIRDQFEGYFGAEFQGQNSDASSIKSDQVIPVSSRAIGFAVQNLYSIAQNNPDFRKRLDQRTSVFKIYRVMMATFENKLCKNKLIYSGLYSDQLKQYSIDEKAYLECVEGLELAPTNVAVAVSLLAPFTYYDRKWVPLQVESATPVAEQVFFTNLSATVTALSNHVVEDFRVKSPLPGAVWADGVLANPRDYWPLNYSVDKFMSEIKEVKE